MRRYLLILLLGLIVVVLGDRLAGYALRHAYEGIDNGEIGKLNHVARQMQADVVVLGSSRALHHYVPSIITDSLGLSCYNAGFEGEGIIFNYALARTIDTRYHPRLFVLELTFWLDAQRGDARTRSMGKVRKLPQSSIRDSVLYDIDRKDRLRMLSAIYPYNNTLMDIVLTRTGLMTDTVRPDSGYVALYKTIAPDQIIYRMTDATLDPVKMHYLEAFVRHYAGRLLVVTSPRYLAQDDSRDYHRPLLDLCEQNGVPYAYLLEDPAYRNDSTLWDDDGHLNHIGAERFTRQLVPYLRHALGTPQNRIDL